MEGSNSSMPPPMPLGSSISAPDTSVRSLVSSKSGTTNTKRKKRPGKREIEKAQKTHPFLDRETDLSKYLRFIGVGRSECLRGQGIECSCQLCRPPYSSDSGSDSDDDPPLTPNQCGSAFHEAILYLRTFLKEDEIIPLGTIRQDSKLIGEGGFARVYPGRWKDKDVALKFLRSVSD